MISALSGKWETGQFGVKLTFSSLNTCCLELLVTEIAKVNKIGEIWREMAEESIFQNLLEILMKASNEIEWVYKESCELVDVDTCLLLIAECFRCLRNACVECVKNQHVMRNLGLIATSVHLIKVLHGAQVKQESLLTAFRCSLQFLGNIAAGNGDSQNSIWKCAFPDLFLTCLTYSDEKIVAYCCMVLFTCLNSERVRELLDPGNLTVPLHVLKVCREELETEWSVTLLELIMAKISEKNPLTNEEMIVFLRHADFLAGCFQEKCQAVLKLTSATDAQDEEALVTIRLLDVLCEMTSNNGQLEHLQALPGLLETAVDTLRLTHLAGKQAVNIFTATHAMTGQEEISHPAVGFKSHLIRLIGNLCYKNKENQDKRNPLLIPVKICSFSPRNGFLYGSLILVCQLDGIPLILDNCSIDDNNPFVNQWAVYAIRNLTEQNERNQELIAQVEERGLADNSVLESMGLRIEKQDDKLILRSVRKNPS
ncbi:ataxin-10 isoform X4 [Apteryx rowi]|uniref:ataxin-10 isoform X4 n=1 Tax=Apteryx rowi TaxID=308060 RepID=UPI000E1D6D71|nr:ataxin-10 isoform X4 [Apteryx rowi]